MGKWAILDPKWPRRKRKAHSLWTHASYNLNICLVHYKISNLHVKKINMAWPTSHNTHMDFYVTLNFKPKIARPTWISMLPWISRPKMARNGPWAKPKKNIMNCQIPWTNAWFIRCLKFFWVDFFTKGLLMPGLQYRLSFSLYVLTLAQKA